MVRHMALSILIIGGLVGALIALAVLLTFGLGPVVALMVFWLGGLAATVALAVDFARNTTLAVVPDEAQSAGISKDGA
jgi:hypothetical protein